MHTDEHGNPPNRMLRLSALIIILQIDLLSFHIEVYLGHAELRLLFHLRNFAIAAFVFRTVLAGVG